MRLAHDGFQWHVGFPGKPCLAPSSLVRLGTMVKLTQWVRPVTAIAGETVARASKRPATASWFWSCHKLSFPFPIIHTSFLGHCDDHGAQECTGKAPPYPGHRLCLASSSPPDSLFCDARPSCDAGCHRLQRANGHGLPQYGRAIEDRRGRRFSQPTFCKAPS